MRLSDVNINPNAITEWNEVKERIFNKLDAREELTLTEEEKKVAMDFTVLCEFLADVRGLDLTNLNDEFGIAADYEKLTGQRLIQSEEKQPKMQ